MTPRERFLAASLLGLVIVLGGLGLFHLFVYQPLSEVGARLTAAQEQLDKKQAELKQEKATIQKIKELDPRLLSWQKISLPDVTSKDPDEITKHLHRLQVDYVQILEEMLRRNGVKNTKVTAQQPDLKSGPSLTTAKTPFYKKLPFHIEGTGTLGAFVQTLEDFYRMNLLHEVRTFTVTKPQTTTQGVSPTDLDIKMTVEALIVSGAEKREVLLPSVDKGARKPAPVLARDKSDYPSIMARNIFLGAAALGDQREKPEEVLRFVKLTSTIYDGRKWDATLWDQGKGKDETRVSLGRVTSKSDFTVEDKFKNVLCRGVVVSVDNHGLVFHANSRFYRLDAGHSLEDALKEPLTAVNFGVGILGTAGTPKEKD